MSRYRFELATPADDADLRRILSETPMEGRIAVSFRREPSYFDAAVVEGDFRQVVAARDCVSGKLVGFGGRSVRLRYVNGRPERIGYLGSLRLLTGHRNRGLVARGYKFLRELHGDQRSSLYLTTIAAGNDAVIRLLTSGRAGLPAYHYIGDYCTLAIPLARRRFQGVVPSGLTIRPATSDDLATILTFLATQGPRRQFFPCYAAQDFFTPAGALRDLRPADLLLAFRDEQLIGTLAAWDQHGFRQNVIHGYSGLMRWSRPFYNAWARLRGLPGLPLSCAPFRHLTGALPVVMDEDPAVFHALLDAIVQHLADSDAKYMLLGLHESDPLVSCAQAHCATCYTTQMYLVCWDDGESLRSRLDCRVPYLELGSL